MKKPVKIVLWILAIPLALIILVIGALAAHPLWLGKVVKSVAESEVPKYTQSAFTLGYCDINLYDGLVALGNIRLENPEGFDERCAAKIGEFKVEVDIDTLDKEVIVIKDIVIRDVFASYVEKDGENNFDVIGDNAKSASNVSDESDVEIKEEGTAKAGLEEIEENVASVDDTESKPEQRVVINHLVISGVSVKWGSITIPVPIDIELNDIGKEEDGITWLEAGREVLAAIVKSLGIIGDDIEGLLDGSVDVANGAIETASGAIEAGEEFLESGTEAVESIKDIGDEFKDVSDEFKDIGEEFKDVGKEFEDLGKGLRDMFKGKKKK